MISIAIVEDTDSDYELLIENISKFFANRNEKVSFMRFSSSEEFLEKFSNVYQLVIFDIELPDGNGMDLAKELRKKDEFVPVFFVTNIKKYTLSGYEVNAFNYILKPINYYSLALTLDRVLNFLSKNKERILEIPSKNGKVYINEKAIRYIEVNGHTIKYRANDTDYFNYGSLKNVEENLVSKCFVRINSYAIVNINFITSIEEGEVYCDNTSFRISRGKKKEIIDQILSLIGDLS